MLKEMQYNTVLEPVFDTIAELGRFNWKERCCCCTRAWVSYFCRRFNWLFGGRFEKFHHLLFLYFSFMQYSSYYFLCIFECLSPVIIIFVDHNTWMHSCFEKAQDRKPYNICCFLWMCCIWSQSIHTAFLAASFLASAWFVTGKYCQTLFDFVAAWNLHCRFHLHSFFFW